MTYLLSIGKDQVLMFQENGRIVNLCYDIIRHLTKTVQMNEEIVTSKVDWYKKYSYVLIYEVQELQGILQMMTEKEALRTSYQKSKEILMLYSCLLGVIRFLEVNLLDNIVREQVGVTQYSQCIRLQTKIMSQLLKPYLTNSRDSNSNLEKTKSSRLSYLMTNKFTIQVNNCFKVKLKNNKNIGILSYSTLEKNITEVDFKKDEMKPIQNSYLHNQVFRKSYVNAKKQIDEYLRQVTMQEISATEIKKLNSLRTFTRNFLRELKNPILKQNQNDQVKSTSEQQTKEHLINKMGLEIDNSSNILLLVGNDTDTKVIVESFLNANLKARTKYKCCILHHCVKENKLTTDCYYLVKNIIFKILKAIPSLKNYFKFAEHNFVTEMESKFDPQSLDLQKDNPEVFIRFCKFLKELKLDYNVGIFITGIHNLWQQNRLDNFIYILRSASLFLPNFIKFVLTIDPNAIKTEKYNKIVKLVQTQSIIELNDGDIFEKEASSYLTFAIQFATQGQTKTEGETKEETKEEKDNKETETFSKNEVIDLCLSKCKQSYRKAIEITHEIYQQGINGKDLKTIQKFIQNFTFIETVYEEQIKQTLKIDQKLAIQIIQVLLVIQSPLNISTLSKIVLLDKQDSESEQNFLSILKTIKFLLNILNSQIYKINSEATPDQYLENPKSTIVLRNKVLLKSVLSSLELSINKKEGHEQILSYHLNIFDDEESDCQYEDLDTYLRVNIFTHLAKSSCKQIFSNMFNLFQVKNIYKQILYHRSYSRFREKLRDIIESSTIEKDDKNQLIQFNNILYLIEQTIKNEPLNYLDFCTQLRGRIIGENFNEFLKDLRVDITSENICYFKNFHYALRENPRIDIVLKLPKTTVLRIKFLSDKQRVIISTSNGLLLLYNTNDFVIQKVFVNKMAILDQIKIIDAKYIITAGIDPKIRIWNIESEKLVSKFQVHETATILMICHKEWIYTYGYDQKFCKFNFKTKTLEVTKEQTSNITALKLLKTVEESAQKSYKIATANANGMINLYDLALNPLKSVSLKSTNEECIQLINLSNTEFMSFTKEGSISVMNNVTLDENKNGSIFQIKSEDYIDLILIKSREYFLFTLERQKIEFYSVNSFKRTDSWDYFFERDLICCDKNKEGSKIFVSDKAGYIILFNFLRHLDQSKENLVPCNRRYDPVVCIEVTERLELNTIVSCSLDRDLRIWRRDNGVFVKKYDLGSFTGENITAMALGKDENMLFLGSKDMNVYLIDISKGKLCVVYEGHWNRVTQIHIIPNKDILITISESNIKVWDLEYDECIKNMNEHNSSVVYIAKTQKDDQVMTVGQAFEFKTWNFMTGDVTQSHEIDIDKDKKSLKNLNVVCCDIQNELAYIALNNNEICVYSIPQNRVLFSFQSYNGIHFPIFNYFLDEQIIFLSGLKSENQTYLLVLTRTACILYSVHKEDVKRICSYLVNARKKPHKKKHDNKYSYNVRYYFTSAKIHYIKYLPKTNFGAQKSVKTTTQQQDQIISQGQSANTDFQNKSTIIMGENIQTAKTIGVQETFAQVIPKESQEQENATKMIDTTGNKIKDTVVLVCLGDSRGFVHMNHLILK